MRPYPECEPSSSLLYSLTWDLTLGVNHPRPYCTHWPETLPWVWTILVLTVLTDLRPYPECEPSSSLLYSLTWDLTLSVNHPRPYCTHWPETLTWVWTILILTVLTDLKPCTGCPPSARWYCSPVGGRDPRPPEWPSWWQNPPAARWAIPRSAMVRGNRWSSSGRLAQLRAAGGTGPERGWPRRPLSETRPNSCECRIPVTVVVIVVIDTSSSMLTHGNIHDINM